MKKSNIIDYKNPSQNLVTDVLSEFLRESAQKMLARAKNAEEVAELTGLSLEKVNSLRTRPF
jgi:hypothetical protein